jgi:hypothetical protein
MLTCEVRNDVLVTSVLSTFSPSETIVPVPILVR